ncbi:SIMPL domain-containing protein [Paenibacillus sediminis]|uniref:Uncharacterized protein YggE n=1 Tax=Paenibacillus sediminis TaxID=664909 RepID=A0ABS4H4R8_9BACL|nr:SIMPL domain-containing protein [Paenibacillus sediminis]MBP1937075.1 uncharacterized protein YggE [Paenibacillus sediminis]
MRTWLKPVSALLITGTLLFAGVGGTASFGEQGKVNAAADESQRNVINVVGKGEISVKPDVAYLSIGVEASATAADEAQKKNAAVIQKINTLLKGTWKIADKDIKTSQFYVQPNYTYNDKEGQKVKGYTAMHILQVTFRDLDNVGKLLDDASKAGANRIDNIRFAVEDPDQFETQVIEKAMANADVKAGAIAKAAKRQVGIVLNVTQGSVDTPIFMEQSYAVAKVADTASMPTNIESGEIKVSTQLSVQYEMK